LNISVGGRVMDGEDSHQLRLTLEFTLSANPMDRPVGLLVETA
jgi:hypothetical protein